MNTETPYYIALGLIPGIGRVLAKHLVSYCGSAKSVFDTPKSKLLKIPNIGEKLAHSIASHQFLKEAQKEIETAQQKGIEILTFNDKAYPQRLRYVVDAPLVIYRLGNADLNAKKVVAIVGTRKATDYGLDLTNQLVRELGRYSDMLIVSGLAYGIDVCAHKRCLELDIPTVGVMANGLDAVYPQVHRKVAAQMLEDGALLTENRFGTKPDAPKFPERNRIIAGMSDVIIVVEAAKKGGALITAELANSYNREVCAFPGNVFSKSSEGCNNLIKAHEAHLITGVEDVEKLMNWDIQIKEEQTVLSFEELDDDERKIMELLRQGNEQIDNISYKTQIAISSLASLLLSLEFKGLVKVLPGKMYGLKR